VSNLKRDPVKFIRDKAKSRYNKGTECRICGDTSNLDFHHYATLTQLYSNWIKANNIVIKEDEDILAVRDDFIAKHMRELYDETVTLCHTHHMKLHSVYGKDPALITAEKQKRWVDKQRVKHGLL
jgi:ABC-type antimicrobial peptide transport system permease subunit